MCELKQIAFHGRRKPVRENGAVPVSPPPPARLGQPSRMHSAVFQPIGDAGRAETVERRIAEAITGGVLRPGERLPSETDLARSFGVAPATAREALQALRKRGLVVTRRGRSGGSFVAESADATAFATDSLRDISRVALRDLAAHYLAITSACVSLAAQRADPSEIARIRHRLQRVDRTDRAAWRRASDDAQIELSALSQSARLTREQMKLQAEFSPYLGLVDRDANGDAARRDLAAVFDAVETGDATRAEQLIRRSVTLHLEWLIDRQAQLQRAAKHG